MRKFYTLEMPEKEMMSSTDMLRYDRAYSIRTNKATGVCRLETIGYTPERWRSFGVNPPRVVLETKITEKEWEHKGIMASGFTAGLRFCQSRLVKERFVKYGHIWLVEDPNSSNS